MPAIEHVRFSLESFPEKVALSQILWQSERERKMERDGGTRRME